MCVIRLEEFVCSGHTSDFIANFGVDRRRIYTDFVFFVFYYNRVVLTSSFYSIIYSRDNQYCTNRPRDRKQKKIRYLRYVVRYCIYCTIIIVIKCN